MRILHLSDTHGHHEMIPESRFKDVDMVIVSGDAGNYRDVEYNETEIIQFLEWFAEVPVKDKLYVAGNHDSSIEVGSIGKQQFLEYGVIYLEDESIEFKLGDGKLKIYGSPYTPTFGNWSFMKARHKLHEVWKKIPNDVDILITHGPPQSILDLAYEFDGSTIKQCGCSALLKRVKEIEPMYHLFGHIHNSYDGKLINSGRTQLSDCKTEFINSSVVTDGKFGRLTSVGNYIEIWY